MFKSQLKSLLYRNKMLIMKKTYKNEIKQLNLKKFYFFVLNMNYISSISNILEDLITKLTSRILK